MRTCSIPDCKGTHDSHGFCGKHAQRFRRYGDPNYLTPEDIRRVRTREAQPTLGQCKPATYRKLFGRHEHRIIAEDKIGRKLLPGEIVHHVDGNKHNNHPDNLEVITQAEHIKEHRAQMIAAQRAAKMARL